MKIEPVAYFQSPFQSKFGIPRQSGLVDKIIGEVKFVEPYLEADSLRGLAEFDYLWLIWGFSENVDAEKHSTVRPPRLGGNERLGVWATRSPFRPNNLGLSSVKIIKVDTEKMLIEVAGADLMDGTPIYDIKPYVSFVDSHPGVQSGFADTHQWESLPVEVPEKYTSILGTELTEALKQTLALDPRPHYHDDVNRVYGMIFSGFNVRFKVGADGVHVLDLGNI